MSRKSPQIVCCKSDIEALERLAGDTANLRLARRASLVLECAGGAQVKDIAARYGERPNTVILWRRRYEASGLAGLENRPRGATGGVYGQTLADRLLLLLKSRPPDGHPQWSGASLARAAGVPLDAVWRHLRKAGIRLREFRASGKARKPECRSMEIPLEITWKENAEMTDEKEKLDIEIVARIKGKDGVVVEKTVRLDGALPSLDDFDLCTREGFLRDFDVLEKAVIEARDRMSSGLAEGYMASASKKKKERQMPPAPAKSKRK